jgi:carbonic anhydrase/acetyltransferase-like protein (isoleucine patch superfamily)
MQEEANIHPTADVSPQASVGEGTRIWQHAQVREGAVVGREYVSGKGVYVGAGVSIGNRAKVQNHALICEGVTLGDGVLVGPQACFTNERLPPRRNCHLGRSLRSPERVFRWDSVSPLCHLSRRPCRSGDASRTRSICAPRDRSHRVEGRDHRARLARLLPRPLPQYSNHLGSPSPSSSPVFSKKTLYV